MKEDILYATGFFEVGDTFYDEDNIQHIVTDVLLCHYMRNGWYKVFYEVDHCGHFVSSADLRIRDPKIEASDIAQKQNRPSLRLIKPNENTLTDEQMIAKYLF